MSDETSLLNKSLKKISYTYRWTGMNVDSSGNSKKENLRYKCLYIMNFLLLNTEVLSSIAWAVQDQRNGGSFTSLTYVAPCITISMLANAKSLSILMHGKEINELLSVLRNLEIKHKAKKTVLEKEKIIKRETKFLSFTLTTVNCFYWFLLVSFPMMPLALMAFEAYNSKEVVRKLPFLVVYPFVDVYDVNVWPVVFVRQIWETVITLFKTCGTDFLFIICVACVCTQFKLLQYDVSRLIPDGRNKQSCEEMHNTIIELVGWHQELIHAAQLLEKINCKSMLFNVVTSSLLICLCGFNILTINDKPYIISFASFLFTSFFQIFTLCYFGDALMESSEGVRNAVYSTNWYLANKSIAKELNIIQMRAQNPCKVTAYSFADINLMAFSAILSSSMSYFALLKTIYDI